MTPAATALRREAAFLSEGVTCRAWVYEPAGDVARPAPCIVMAHGLGGTRDASLQPYAESLAAAGFYVLLFDYRYLGDSDGEPRQLISMQRQLEDWRAAITFARGMPGVDADRIGLWGCSLSGGHVLVAAARDAGIAAVSAQCPMLDGAASARMAVKQAGTAMAVRMAGAALLDVARACLGQRPHYVPLAAPPGELAAMATPDAYAGCMAIVPPTWRNEVAARLFLTLPLYRPIRHARDVKCPTLLIACAHDSVVSTTAAIKTAARMGSKARLITLPIGHFDIYLGEWLQRSSAEQIAFFQSVLQSARTVVKAR
ncbi:MAG: alpha/beta fold hydrolase [Hyphomicrobium sp.]|nr:alpha/beta fold hydrolase [Hyphomicrobium sp.]